MYVADLGNNRVLRFAYPPATDRPDAEAVLGHEDFTSNGTNTDRDGMTFPSGVFVDKNGTLWVADRFNNRVLRFDNAAMKANGADADGVLGQAGDFTTKSTGTSAAQMDRPTGVFGDDSGNLYVKERGNDRIRVFVNIINNNTVTDATFVIGQTMFGVNGKGTSATTLDLGAPANDLVVDSQNGILWVNDDNNNRVLGFQGMFSAPLGFDSQNDLMFGDPCSCLDPRNCEVGGITYFHDTLTITDGAGLIITAEAGATNFFIDLPCFGGGPTLIGAGTTIDETAVGSGVYKIEFWRPSGALPTLSVFAGGVSTTVPSATFEPVCSQTFCEAQIPTLGQWGLILLSLLLLIVGVAGVRGSPIYTNPGAT